MNDKEELWQELKVEYVTKKSSLDKLCKKYKLSLSTALKKCSAEGWVEERKKYRKITDTEIYRRMSNEEAKRYCDAEQGIRRLLYQINSELDPKKRKLYKYVIKDDKGAIDSVDIEVLNSEQADRLLNLTGKAIRQLDHLGGFVAPEVELEAKLQSEAANEQSGDINIILNKNASELSE